MRYTLELDCRRCGHPLEHAATGTSDGRSTRAVAHCPQCRDDWLIEVRISSRISMSTLDAAPNRTAPRPSRCGTETGYKAHCRRKEPRCDACKHAHAVAESARKARRRREREVAV